MEVLYKKYRAYILICCAVLVSTFVLWMPFILRISSINGIQTFDIDFRTVMKNWDGPLYIIPAKTLYDVDNPVLQKAPLGLAPGYFAAHLPGYPLTIAVLAPVLGFLKAMLASTVIASLGLFSFFYYFVKKLKLTSEPLLLTFVFMFITPRFFVVRSIGSPEPLFLLLILSSIFFFVRKKYVVASILGAVSLLTKTPGGLLFFTYVIFFLSEYVRTKKFDTRWLWILLIPGAFLGLSYFYSLQLGDFWAYFHSGDNIHLLFPPFQVFNYQATWIGTGWLEDIVLIYLLYGYTLINLLPFSGFGAHLRFFENVKNGVDNLVHGEELHKVKEVFFYFTFVFFIVIILIQHRDVARYSLPLLPIALITFERFFTSKKFVLILILFLPAIYMYAWNFMLTNAAPITEWGAFM